MQHAHSNHLSLYLSSGGGPIGPNVVCQSVSQFTLFKIGARLFRTSATYLFYLFCFRPKSLMFNVYPAKVKNYKLFCTIKTLYVMFTFTVTFYFFCILHLLSILTQDNSVTHHDKQHHHCQILFPNNHALAWFQLIYGRLVASWPRCSLARLSSRALIVSTNILRKKI